MEHLTLMYTLAITFSVIAMGLALGALAGLAIIASTANRRRATFDVPNDHIIARDAWTPEERAEFVEQWRAAQRMWDKP